MKKLPNFRDHKIGGKKLWPWLRDSFHDIKVIISQKIISIFKGLFSDQTDPGKVFWNSLSLSTHYRSMQAGNSWWIHIQRLVTPKILWPNNTRKGQSKEHMICWSWARKYSCKVTKLGITDAMLITAQFACILSTKLWHAFASL
jgi:hypothetical protein